MIYAFPPQGMHTSSYVATYTDDTESAVHHFLKAQKSRQLRRLSLPPPPYCLQFQLLTIAFASSVLIASIDI